MTLFTPAPLFIVWYFVSCAVKCGSYRRDILLGASPAKDVQKTTDLNAFNKSLFIK
jgi:hypothetical protein